MKKTYLLLCLLSTVAIAQQPYYDDVNIQLTGQALYDELQNKLETYNIEYTYSDYRDGMPITDVNPEDDSEVLLVYGYSDTDSNCITDRTRNNGVFGGNNCEYNREHTFPRSLANPPMGSTNGTTVGIAADPHNLRPSDVQRNGQRGSKKYAAGSGNSGDVGSGNWYPGDEWRGDVARAMMYMYVRYGDRCLPSLVGQGALQGDTEMLELFLQWNVDDPVSTFEQQRNDPLELAYASRNPFIDNPYLATLIWGGPTAENTWEALSIAKYKKEELTLFPNPVSDFLTLSNVSNVQNIAVYSLSGQKLHEQSNTNAANSLIINLEDLSSGIYIIKADEHIYRLLKK